MQDIMQGHDPLPYDSIQCPSLQHEFVYICLVPLTLNILKLSISTQVMPLWIILAWSHGANAAILRWFRLRLAPDKLQRWRLLWWLAGCAPNIPQSLFCLIHQNQDFCKKTHRSNAAPHLCHMSVGSCQSQCARQDGLGDFLGFTKDMQARRRSKQLLQDLGWTCVVSKGQYHRKKNVAQGRSDTQIMDFKPARMHASMRTLSALHYNTVIYSTIHILYTYTVNSKTGGNSVLDGLESNAIFHPVQMCDANGQQAPEAGSTRLGFPAHL